MIAKGKRLAAILTTLAMVLVLLPVQAFAEDSTDVSAMYTDTINVLQRTVTDEVSSTNAWYVMTAARAGVLTAEQAEAYYTNLENTVKNQDSSVLPNGYGGNINISTILAVTAIGKDASNVAGYNLLEPLADMANNTGYASTTANVLLALDSKNYTIPTAAEGATQTTREALIQSILDQRIESVGNVWGYEDWNNPGIYMPDIDTTAMCIQALAPYYSSNEAVKTAVDTALAYLSNTLAAGGSASYGNACTDAQVLTALTAMNINPTSDERFLVNGSSLLDGLAQNYVAGSGFNYYGALDLAYATYQAGYALEAYERFLNQKNALYNMTDAVDVIAAAEASTEVSTEASTEVSTEATTAAKDASPATGDAAPLAAVAAEALMALTGAAVCRRKKQG